MTVMTTARKVIGFGNGATTVWPYAFLIPLANQLSVIYTNPNRDAIDPTGLGVVLNPALYAVTGIGNVGGGNVTYPLAGSPAAAPVTITIVRTIPKTQPSTMQNQGASYPATYEAALDNIEMQVQEVVEIFNRSFSLPIGFDVVGQGVNLTVPAPVANMVLGWDPTAKFLVNLAAVPGLVIAPLIGGLLFGAVGNTVAQDANNLFWDNTNKRLGIGNAAPSVALDVTGTVKSSVSIVTPNVLSPASTNLVFSVSGVGNAFEITTALHLRPVADVSFNIGDATHRINGIFASSIDSGSSASFLLKTSNGATQAKIINAGDGTNFLGVQGGATTFGPVAFANGADTNIPLELVSKGTASIRLSTGGGFSGDINSARDTQVQILAVNAATRSVTLIGATGTNQVIVGATAGGVAIVGTATNDNAATGQYGEFASTTLGSGSAVALATVTPSNVVSVTLGAGDWDVCGTVSFIFGATTSYTNLIGDFSLTSGTLDVIIGHFFDYETPAQVPTAGSDQAWVMPTARFSLSASTTIFLVAQATFTVSTLKAYGTIRARRVR